MVTGSRPFGVPQFWSLRQGRAFSAKYRRGARFAPGNGLAIGVASPVKTRPCRGLQNNPFWVNRSPGRIPWVAAKRGNPGLYDVTPAEYL